jgi:hypothetical protein
MGAFKFGSFFLQILLNDKEKNFIVKAAQSFNSIHSILRLIFEKLFLNFDVIFHPPYNMTEISVLIQANKE